MEERAYFSEYSRWVSVTQTHVASRASVAADSDTQPKYSKNIWDMRSIHLGFPVTSRKAFTAGSERGRYGLIGGTGAALESRFSRSETWDKRV